MSRQSYKGLTWDHPRGYRALDAAAALAGQQGLSIQWDRQPLEGFESRPIAELAELYDLLVLDHPHLGDALDAHCLAPLGDVLGADTINQIARATIGPCAESYRLDGNFWALPLDAAAQVMAYRPDLLEGELPVTWDALTISAECGGVALSLAGPHALLTLLSIAASIGTPAGDNALFDPAYGAEAYAILASLYANAVPAALPLNPIGLLDHMAVNRDIVLCPLVFGYVNYTAPLHGRPIAFGNAPATAVGGRPGSVLGGTGIGITKRCQITPDLVTHLAWLLGAEAQTRFIPNHAGQPSRRNAWADGAVNTAWPSFYAATARTLETAYVRPRLKGFVPMQLEAAATIRAVLAERSSGPALIDRLNGLYRGLNPVRKVSHHDR